MFPDASRRSPEPPLRKHRGWRGLRRRCDVFAALGGRGEKPRPRVVGVDTGPKVEASLCFSLLLAGAVSRGRLFKFFLVFADGCPEIFEGWAVGYNADGFAVSGHVQRWFVFPGIYQGANIDAHESVSNPFALFLREFGGIDLD